MRTISGLLCILALTFGAVAGFAADKEVRILKSTTKGKPIPPGSIKFLGPDNHSLASYKAQNHLSAATNQLIKNTALKAPAFHNGTALNTIPYFQNWFITGTRNSVYPYSMVGQSPPAGGTTGINNQIIPLVTVLQEGGVTLYTFDPTIANDPQGTDISLTTQSPLYDATTKYPGPPADTGQFLDTSMRAEFNSVRKADWHTLLNPPSSSGIVWIQQLEYNNGDWACVSGEAPPCTSFPVVNINTISNNFGFILAVENPPNSTVPIIETDYVTAFVPGGGCCVLGYHSTQPGTNPPGANSVLVWTWASFIPQSNNPFAPFGDDVMVLSHELSELYNDPFVATGGTAVSPWVDGSVSFAQANLETGDVIEGMAAADVVYPVPLAPNGQAYTYTIQNVALLAWFTRNPLHGGLYSWPNEHTLSQCPHVQSSTPSWCYGEGSAGFFFGPPY